MRLKNPVTILTLSIVLFSLAGLVSCAHGVKYVSENPPTIHIPDSRQPVSLTVLDKRKSKYVRQLDEGTEYRGALNPDQLRTELSENPHEKVRTVLNEYLVGRNVGVVMNPNQNFLTFELHYFDVEYVNNEWKAKVVMKIESDAKEQILEASFSKANKSGNYDGEVAISTALSMLIDRIDWPGLLPEISE